MTANGRKIREQLLALLEQKDYRPLTKIDIARELGLPDTQRNALRKTLRELERAGQIARIRKNRYVLPAEADLIAGKLSIHQAGYGFLTPETPGGMFSSQQRTSGQPCMATAWLRAYRAIRLMTASKGGAKDVLFESWSALTI